MGHPREVQALRCPMNISMKKTYVDSTRSAHRNTLMELPVMQGPSSPSSDIRRPGFPAPDDLRLARADGRCESSSM